MKYFISDHHWGHISIIKMSNRPFNNLHEMNLFMIDEWNKTVGINDDVYYLGDLMYKMNPKHFVRNVLNKLNGKIYLIIGNHDEKHLHKYIHRFEWAKDVHYMNYEYNNKIYNFVLYHYPIYSWKGIYKGYIHIHGHTHKKKEIETIPKRGNILNVNCEFLDYKPISIEEIINKFKK